MEPDSSTCSHELCEKRRAVHTIIKSDIKLKGIAVCQTVNREVKEQTISGRAKRLVVEVVCCVKSHSSICEMR